MTSQHIKPQVEKGDMDPLDVWTSSIAYQPQPAAIDSVINIIQHSKQLRAKDEIKNTLFKNSRTIYQTISKLAKARS